MVIRRKYNTATASGTHIRVPIVKAGATDFATGSDWTPASGDVKLSKDGGSQNNIGTLPTFSNGAWEFQLTGSELSCKQLEIMVVDSATKAVNDQCILIETFGNASAMWQADISAAELAADVTKISGDATAADNAESFFDGTGYAGTNNVIPTVTNVTNLPGAIRSNTLQSGSTSTTAKLDAGASATNDLYNGAMIVLTGGTGAGQCNAIVDYDGTSKVADVAHTWITTPDNTTTFSILPQAPEALSAWNSAALNEAKMGKNSLYAAIQKNTGEVDTVSTAGQAITKRTGGTEHFRQALTTDAAADPITIVGAAS